MTDDDLVKAREAERVMREYAAHPSSFTVPDSEQARSVADLIDALIAEVRDREDVLERAGFRRCDISACNCGSWHQVGGFKARFDEIKEAIAEHVDLNGKTLLTAVQEALAERNALAREVDACAAALPGPYYMDPPDGGDVPISEQVKRMARDAARYREFVVSGGWHRHIDGEHPEESYSYLVVGLPVDADLSCYAARKLVMDKVLDEGSERCSVIPRFHTTRDTKTRSER